MLKTNSRLRNNGSLIRVLADIRSELARIADCLEYDLADRGVVTRVPETTHEASSLEYVDDEIEWARENIPDFDKKLNAAVEAEIHDYRYRVLAEAENILGDDNPETHRED